MPSTVMPACHFLADTGDCADQAEDQAKDHLVSSFLGLLDLVIDNQRRLADSSIPLKQDQAVPTQSSQLSYNLVMTTEWMMLVP